MAKTGAFQPSVLYHLPSGWLFFSSLLGSPFGGAESLAYGFETGCRVQTVQLQKEAIVKRSMVALAVMLLGVGVYAQRGGGRGGGPSPGQREALAKQEELEKATPRLQQTDDVLKLVVP